MSIVLRADVIFPSRASIGTAVGPLFLGVRSRQRIVDHGDLVPEDVLVGLVEIDPLLDHRLAVAVERDAGRIVTARVLEETCLDFEYVVLAVAILIDPLADRIARECRLRALRPWPAI